MQKNEHLTTSHYFLEDIETNSKGDDSSTLTLSPKKFYTIVFCNSKQIFINVQLVLKDLFLKINQDKSITIKNQANAQDPEWKSKTMLEIKNFFAKRATYVELKMVKEIVADPKLVERIVLECKEINKCSSALYFELKKDLLICCGTKLALAKKLLTMPDLIKKIVLEHKRLVFQLNP
jgi:hypothetical protein